MKKEKWEEIKMNGKMQNEREKIWRIFLDKCECLPSLYPVYFRNMLSGNSPFSISIETSINIFKADFEERIIRDS